MLKFGCTKLVPREESVLVPPMIDRTDLRSIATIELNRLWRFYPNRLIPS
jgi:hypothetical protein